MSDDSSSDSPNLSESSLPLIDTSLDDAQIPAAGSLDEARHRVEEAKQEASAPGTPYLDFSVGGEPMRMSAEHAEAVVTWAAQAEQYVNEINQNPLVQAIARGDIDAVTDIAERIVWNRIVAGEYRRGAQVRPSGSSQPTSDEDLAGALEVFKNRGQY